MAVTVGINIGLSGLQAAEQRFRNSADNVANVRSPAAPSVDGPTTDEEGNPLFQPRQSVDQSVEGGGVRSTQQLVDPSAVQQFDPDASDANEDGLVNRANVELDREVAEQITAQRQFEANLATIQTADELSESTLDILS